MRTYIKPSIKPSDRIGFLVQRRFPTVSMLRVFPSLNRSSPMPATTQLEADVDGVAVIGYVHDPKLSRSNTPREIAEYRPKMTACGRRTIVDQTEHTPA
jgi:hypothetical protein